MKNGIVIGIILSLIVAVVFDDASMAVTTSICYLAAVIVGVFCVAKKDNESADSEQEQEKI